MENSITASNLKELIKKDGSVMATILEPQQRFVERRMMHKLLDRMDDTFTKKVKMPET